MKLADTCVWIEAILGSPTGEYFYPVLRDPHNLLVSHLVQFELRRWALRELGEEQADAIVLATREAQVLQTTENIVLLAADLTASHKLHALDALIYATALQHDAQLVTCDPHFKGLPQVDYLPKLK
jgi:predicted nucleic acid-binding protein